MEDGGYYESGEYEVVLDFGSVMPYFEMVPVQVEYFIYLLTPFASPKSYVMKLPPGFQQDGFLELSDAIVEAPVQWCTYATHESPSVVVVRVITAQEAALVAALGRACEWLQTLADLEDMPTNVQQLVCGREALLSLDTSGGALPQWVYGTPVGPSPPVVYSWSSSPRAQLAAATDARQDYISSFCSPRDSFRTRFPCWQRLHFEHAVTVPDLSVDMIYLSPDHSSFNLEDFFGTVPPFLGFNELGQEQIMTDVASASHTPAPSPPSQSPERKEPDLEEKETTLEAVVVEDAPDVNALHVGDWVVYLDPAFASRPHTFIRTRIVGIDKSKRCWVELENNHHQTHFERGPVCFAKFNNDCHQLLTPLQPLSVFH